MAAAYIVEEEAWKCLKHPSKRGRNGVCPVCLKDRLLILCPDCATVRPCACVAATSSSTSASSSFGRTDIGSASSILDGDPNFRRSNSVGVPVLRQRDGLFGSFRRNSPANCDNKTPWFRSFFKSSSKSGRTPELKEDKQSNADCVAGDGGMEEFTVLMRSRSMSVEVTPSYGDGDVRKAKGWHFRSPVKAFRQAKVVQERSPLFSG